MQTRSTADIDQKVTVAAGRCSTRSLRTLCSSMTTATHCTPAIHRICMHATAVICRSANHRICIHADAVLCKYRPENHRSCWALINEVSVNILPLHEDCDPLQSSKAPQLHACRCGPLPITKSPHLHACNCGPLQISKSPCLHACNCGPLQSCKAPCSHI